MKILAFDQSTQKTGWALYAEGMLTDYGLIDLHKTKDSNDRLRQMGIEVDKMIRLHAPNIVVIEDVSLQNPNVKTIVELARLQGMILLSAHLSGDIIVKIYTPSAWRKIVGIQTGRGIKRADLKSSSRQLVVDLHDINVSDDIADAILLGRAASSHME